MEGQVEIRQTNYLLKRYLQLQEFLNELQVQVGSRDLEGSLLTLQRCLDMEPNENQLRFLSKFCYNTGLLTDSHASIIWLKKALDLGKHLNDSQLRKSCLLALTDRYCSQDDFAKGFLCTEMMDRDFDAACLMFYTGCKRKLDERHLETLFENCLTTPDFDCLEQAKRLLAILCECPLSNFDELSAKLFQVAERRLLGSEVHDDLFAIELRLRLENNSPDEGFAALARYIQWIVSSKTSASRPEVLEIGRRFVADLQHAEKFPEAVRWCEALVFLCQHHGLHDLKRDFVAMNCDALMRVQPERIVPLLDRHLAAAPDDIGLLTLKFRVLMERGETEGTFHL